MSRLGERLKKLRQDKKLSLRELGKRAGLSHSFIADIESGRSKPSIDTLKSLTKSLDVPISTLIEGTEYNDALNQPNDPDKAFQEALAMIPDLTKTHNKEYAMARIRDLLETVIPGLAGKEVPETHVNLIMANIEAVIEELKKEKEGKQ